MNAVLLATTGDTYRRRFSVMPAEPRGTLRAVSRGLGRTQKAIIADVEERYNNGNISTTKAVAESLGRDQRQVRKAVDKLVVAGLLKADYNEMVGWREDCGPWREWDYVNGGWLSQWEKVGMPVSGMLIYPAEATTRQEAFVASWSAMTERFEEHNAKVNLQHD